MQNLKTYFHFDKALISLIDESNDFEINVILYVARYFKNLKNEIDFYTEESLNDKELLPLGPNESNLEKNRNREEMLKFVDINESECLIRCRQNEELFQLQLDSILKLIKDLIDRFPHEQDDLEEFVIGQEYFKKIAEIKRLSLELGKELFNRNYFCLKSVNTCDLMKASIDSKMKSFKLFVIEPFCMDDIQIDLLKYDSLMSQIRGTMPHY